MRQYLFPALICLGSLLALGDTPPAPNEVRACDDASGWPPYLWEEKVGGKTTGVLRGYAVDVFNLVVRELGYQPRIDLLPWERCLEMVRRGRYHLAVNGSFSALRASDFLLTRPYYQTHSAYFYSRRKYPGGLTITGLPELKRYRACGMLGYNYQTYGLAPADMDTGANRFPQLIAKLHAGRCDLFIEKREVMAGFGLTDPEMAKLLANPLLGQADLPGVPATGFHMMVSRALVESEQLHRQLDEALGELERRGALARIGKRYFR